MPVFAAALLHDAVEDQGISRQAIAAMFVVSRWVVLEVIDDKRCHGGAQAPAGRSGPKKFRRRARRERRCPQKESELAEALPGVGADKAATRARAKPPGRRHLSLGGLALVAMCEPDHGFGWPELRPGGGCFLSQDGIPPIAAAEGARAALAINRRLLEAESGV
jgi:hypothetical protein